jgi:hypothetical protein
MPRFVPLLRYLNCSLMGRDVFVKRDLHHGEGVDSVCQAIELSTGEGVLAQSLEQAVPHVAVTDVDSQYKRFAN